MKNRRGFFTVVTLDRFDELRRFLISLSKFHPDVPVCIYVAKDRLDAFRSKTQTAFLSPFDLTVLIDVDIYVNGKLDYLFDVAEQEKIGIVKHPRSGDLNTGVVCFSKSIMQPFSKKWTKIFDERLKDKSLFRLEYDQGIFNTLAPEMPLRELSTDYNATFHDITPEEELERWDEIKIFHFLHSWPEDKEKFKSYRLFMEL